MGARRYPPLSSSEVIAILNELGFVFKRQDGSHAQYERVADEHYERALVTVDTSIPEFWEEIIKSMIRQSKHSREEFYGATKGTAKKINLQKAFKKPSTKCPKCSFEFPFQTDLGLIDQIACPQCAALFQFGSFVGYLSKPKG